MHSGGDILQDCSSEHSSLTKTESDPPGDLSLPGKSFSLLLKPQQPARKRKEAEYVLCMLSLMYKSMYIISLHFLMASFGKSDGLALTPRMKRIVNYRSSGS